MMMTTTTMMMMMVAIMILMMTCCFLPSVPLRSAVSPAKVAVGLALGAKRHHESL